ncbi:VWA domain-containing protein [Terrihabitans soli]|uniref:VWA domain-containing protein n=1 Tax=Terrihabitans soli TaxID=708113 RepID=A0A6S6QHY1_9HYPH|nr:VWA domain-containing protein [Terrihabitans soli]BCJ90823.1 VWA domain-containing protein [Terrihabitans soli]
MFRRLLAALAVFAALAPLSFSSWPASAQAKGPADAVLILDASGSMWGLVEGRTKMSAARTAVGTIIDKWQPDHKLGLMAYGHRTKGDCADIELIQPIGPLNGDALRGTVQKITPKGKTPISASLRLAAEQLKSTENPATVILVSDGIETCNADPCAVAAELEKSGVNFTAHVIGFDVADPATRAQLQCIARNTGGVYLDAKNASGLEDALGKAVEAAQGEKIASEAPPEPEKKDPLAGKNWRGVVRLAEGLDPIEDSNHNVVWSLFVPDTAGDPGEFVQTEYGSPLAAVAKPGTYAATVEFFQTKRILPMTVTAAPSVQDVVLNAGYVTSEGALAGSGAKAEGVNWDIKTAAGEYVATSYDAVPRFVLPAGSYVMTLTKGAAKAEKPFEVTAGDSINLAVTLDAGRLVASAVYSASGPDVTDGIAVEVFKPAAGPGANREWIATMFNAQSVFELPAGRYDLAVTVGAAKKFQPVDVTSGQTTEVKMDLNAGVLGLDAPGAEFIEVMTAKKDINGQVQMVHYSYDPKMNVTLTAGDYVIRTTKAGAVKETPASIRPGERSELSIAP